MGGVWGGGGGSCNRTSAHVKQIAHARFAKCQLEFTARGNDVVLIWHMGFFIDVREPDLCHRFCRSIGIRGAKQEAGAAARTVGDGKTLVFAHFASIKETALAMAW